MKAGNSGTGRDRERPMSQQSNAAFSRCPRGEQTPTWREAPALPRPESSGRIRIAGLRVVANSRLRTDESVRGKCARKRHVAPGAIGGNPKESIAHLHAARVNTGPALPRADLTRLPQLSPGKRPAPPVVRGPGAGSKTGRETAGPPQCENREPPIQQPNDKNTKRSQLAGKTLAINNIKGYTKRRRLHRPRS